MKAIQTRYAGCHFRSRLEARYAVLFDTLKIKWDYEPEGFELGASGRYLPDFWLHIPDKPGWGYWVEIKPVRPLADELDKLKRVCRLTGHRGWLFIGTPGESRVVDEATGRFSAFETCAPIKMCPPAPMTPAHLLRAITAARSARFEFKDRNP